MPEITAGRSRKLVAASLATLCLFGFLFSCSQLDDVTPREDRPAITLSGVQLFRHDEAGNVIVKIVSDRAEYHDGQQTGIVYDAELWFYNADGEEALYLTADEMDYDFDSGNLEVRGNISGHESGGTSFETEHAFWNEETGILAGESPVYAERDNGHFRAQSFTYQTEIGELLFAKVAFVLELPTSEE